MFLQYKQNNIENRKEYEVNEAKTKLNALMGVTDPLKANVPDYQIPLILLMLSSSFFRQKSYKCRTRKIDSYDCHN